MKTIGYWINYEMKEKTAKNKLTTLNIKKIIFFKYLLISLSY